MSAGRVVQKSRGDRLEAIDGLRGIAALAVACFHLSGRGLFAYGWAGLEVFFVISGFIVPWSLDRAGYDTRLYGRFLLRRIVRLDPPYLVMIGVILALDFLSWHTPGFAGTASFIGWPAVFGHVAFLNAFTEQPWLSPVFWTLAIEFQYYVLIGLLYPIVASSVRATRCVAAAVCLCAPLYRHWALAVFSCLFLMGIVTFQYRTKRSSQSEFLILLAAATTAAWFSNGWLAALAGAMTALIIGFGWRGTLTSKPVLWLGSISYSLYLVHTTIGGRVVNLGKRLPQDSLILILVFITALAVSLIAALLLNRFVERPARDLASRIAWRRNQLH